MIQFTDGVGWTGQTHGMQVLVTISVADDEGEELDTVSASAETPQEAFELALQQLDVEVEE